MVNNRGEIRPGTTNKRLEGEIRPGTTNKRLEGEIRPGTTGLPRGVGLGLIPGALKSGSGGGGSPSASTRPIPIIDQNQNKQAEQQRINSQFSQEVNQARNQFRQNIRNIRGIQGRQDALNQLNQTISNARMKASAQRIKSGITTKATIGGQLITRENADSFLKNESKKQTNGRGEIRPGSTTKKGRVIPQLERKGVFKTIEEEVSKRTTKPIGRFIKRKTGLTPEKLGDIATEVEPPRVGTGTIFGISNIPGAGIRGPAITSESAKQTQSGFIKGVVEGVRDEPVKTGLTIGAFAALPRALGVGSRLSQRAGITPIVQRITPTAIKKLTRFTLTKGLLGAYIGATGLEVASQPDAKSRGTLLGRKTSTEILPFVIGTRLGVRGELRSQIKAALKTELKKLPANKRAEFENYMKQTEVFGKTKVEVGKVDLEGLDRIPAQTRPAVLKHLKDPNIVLGGSVGQKTQVKIKRPLGQSDLDLYIESGSVNEEARKLAQVLRNNGAERVSVIRGSVTVNGKKAAEFHDMDRLITNIESVIPFWKTPRSFITTSKNGIRVPKITVQVRRKLVGGFTDPKRQKDLVDFRDAANQLFKKAELQARQSFFFKEKRLKALENKFGVKLLDTSKTTKLKKPSLLSKPVGTQVTTGGVLRGTPKTSKRINLKREPLIISRAKAKGNKPFSQAPSQFGVKKPVSLLSPSQKGVKKPSKASQPAIRKPSKPSQVPAPKIKSTSALVPSQPPTRRIGGPSQPPTRIQSILTPPLRPSRRPRKSGSIRPPSFFKPTQIIKKKVVKKKIAPTKKQGYNAFAKQKGFLKRISSRPVSKSTALNQASFVVDRSTSAFGLIRKVSGAARKPLVKVPANYFKKNQSKFRTHRIVKGKKVPLKNSFIELRGKRIDSRGEKKGLSAARLIKRLRKPLKKVRRRIKK